MPRIHPLLKTPDFLTGDAIAAFLEKPAEIDQSPSAEWQCAGCGTLYIFDGPTPRPDEDCRSCRGFFWKPG